MAVADQLVAVVIVVAVAAPYGIGGVVEDVIQIIPYVGRSLLAGRQQSRT